jgi:F0F1-type ATP synthase assembly protein I
MKPDDDLRGQVLRSMTLTAAIGVDMACVLLICVLIGHYIDTRAHTDPWGLLVGILAGVIGAGLSAYHMITRFFR